MKNQALPRQPKWISSRKKIAFILDIFLDDPHWADWSASVLADWSVNSTLYIKSTIYAEVSVGFEKIEEVEKAIRQGGFQMLDIPKEALFLAGKAYIKHRNGRGNKNFPLPDFYIGAQAAVLGLCLITRDISRYRTCFPTVRLVCPD